MSSVAAAPLVTLTPAACAATMSALRIAYVLPARAMCSAEKLALPPQSCSRPSVQSSSDESQSQITAPSRLCIPSSMLPRSAASIAANRCVALSTCSRSPAS